MTLFAVVELMGHRTRAGAISDATMGGATLLRIEHPERTMLAEYYAPAAIFSIRPCSEEEATKVATWAWGEAVSRPALGPAFVELVDEDGAELDGCSCSHLHSSGVHDPACEDFNPEEPF